MGYDHSLTTTVTFINPVTEDKILEILAPLSVTFEWTPEQILKNNVPKESEIILVTNGQGLIKQLFLETKGEVGYEFLETANKVAEQLSLVAVTNYMELVDYDSGCLNDATQRIWYGEEKGIAIAKLSKAWGTCTMLLSEAGVSDDDLFKMAAVINK